MTTAGAVPVVAVGIAALGERIGVTDALFAPCFLAEPDELGVTGVPLADLDGGGVVGV